MEPTMDNGKSVEQQETRESQLRSLAEAEQAILLGPDLGLESYLRYAPKETSQREYALNQVVERFSQVADQFSPEADAVEKARNDRVIMWERYAELKERIRENPDVSVKDTVFDYLIETNPLAADQLAAFDKGLGKHLKEVEDFCASFLLTENGESRFPDTFNDRQAALIAEVAAPLHDSLKFLGSFQAQVMPDHEIMIAELIRTEFEHGLVHLQGVETKLTAEDVAFLSGIVGDHENIYKEEGRRDFIHSQDPIERGKAAFFVADVLTGVIVESDVGGAFTIDHDQLQSRFADLYFRHIDLEKGKVFRPEWGKTAIQDIIETVQELQQQGVHFEFDGKDQTVQSVLCSCAVDVIDHAIEADDHRVAAKAGQPEFTSEQRDRIARSREALEAML